MSSKYRHTARLTTCCDLRCRSEHFGGTTANAMLAPFDPYTPDLGNRLQPPSAVHWLGTDTLGRDMLSRLIFGARVTLVVVLIALAISAAIGIAVGLIAGYLRGRVDTVISRTVDAMLAIPSIFVALALAAARGPGQASVVIAVSIVLWARFARVIRQPDQFRSGGGTDLITAVGTRQRRDPEFGGPAEADDRRDPAAVGN